MAWIVVIVLIGVVFLWRILRHRNGSLKPAHGGYTPTKGDRLLKRATELQKQGDTEGAIAKLKDAYSHIAKSDGSHTVSTYLRLPNCLHKAGRNDEAWREYNKLLTEGYPNQQHAPELFPMEHSQIYDKMRLFLQREGKMERAVVFGILSLISWELGLRLQKRKKEYATYKAVEKTVFALLKKAKQESQTTDIAKHVWNNISQLPKVDFAQLSRFLSKKVSKQDS